MAADHFRRKPMDFHMVLLIYQVELNPPWFLKRIPEVWVWPRASWKAWILWVVWKWDIVCVYMCIYIGVYMCMYVYICVYMCIYVIICVYITCIYTYTRIYIYIFQSVRGIFLRCVTLNSWVYPYVICMVSPFLLFWWTCELGVWINVDFLQQCEKTGPQTTAQTLAVFCPKDISGLWSSIVHFYQG